MENKFKIAIIGLGLMGGSFAFALAGYRDCHIIGYDLSPETSSQALSDGAINEVCHTIKQAVEQAELVIFCTPPQAIVQAVNENMFFFKDGAVITEICGVKHEIYSKLIPIMPDNVDFLGIHPMAGKEVGGFRNADKSIFKNAGFIIVSHERAKDSVIEFMRQICLYVGAGRVCVNDVQEHDSIIAYTSDLMHIAAAGLCVDYPHNMTMAHTAGAFRDCTRIATIDARMWTELLLENREYIIPYLQEYISNLTKLCDGLFQEDRLVIHDLLDKSDKNKREMMKL